MVGSWSSGTLRELLMWFPLPASIIRLRFGLAVRGPLWGCVSCGCRYCCRGDCCCCRRGSGTSLRLLSCVSELFSMSPRRLVVATPSPWHRGEGLCCCGARWGDSCRCRCPCRSSTSRRALARSAVTSRRPLGSPCCCCASCGLGRLCGLALRPRAATPAEDDVVGDDILADTRAGPLFVRLAAHKKCWYTVYSGCATVRSHSYCIAVQLSSCSVVVLRRAAVPRVN